MNALARELRPEPQRRGGGTPEVTWTEIAARAPVMVATMASYLDHVFGPLRMEQSRLAILSPVFMAIGLS